MTDEHRATLTALGQVLKQQFDKRGPGSHRLEFPAPVVNVTTPEQAPPVVNVSAPAVDLEALTRLLSGFLTVTTDVLAKLSATIDEMATGQARLFQALMKREPTVVNLPSLKPRIVVEPQITFQPPQAVEQEPRPKRSLTVRHDDGTESVITEN